MTRYIPAAGGQPFLSVGEINFTYDACEECFRHNLARDLHIVCIWEGGQSVEEAGLEVLPVNFRLIGLFRIQWSRSEVDGNLSRLHGTMARWGGRERYDTGRGPFLCAVVEDTHPRYKVDYARSGTVRFTNENVVQAARTLEERAAGSLVHATAHPSEFLEQVHLLFPEDCVDDLLLRSETAGTPQSLSRDLTGHAGWESFDRLFRHLNRTTSYVVLRNFETILTDFSEGDIDVLCTDAPSFVSMINGTNATISSGVVKCEVSVAGQTVPVDVRFVGDGYLDASWQRDILSTRHEHEGVLWVPRPDHYYFSLLYHAAFQKPTLSSKYLVKLSSLGQQIGIPHDVSAAIADPARAVEIMRDFFQAKSYAFSTPLDAGVYINRKSVALLGRRYTDTSHLSARSCVALAVRSLVRVVRRAMPGWLVRAAPTALKDWLRRAHIR